MPDLSEKISKELATKYGYVPGEAKQVLTFVKGIHNFSHYLGNNKYFSDTLNKRVAVLSLDCDILSLKAERVRLLAEGFYTQVELSIVAKSKPAIDKAKVVAFKKEMQAVLDEAMSINDRALKLMADIKEEYGEKDGAK
jgi:hypothetical protein